MIGLKVPLVSSITVIVIVFESNYDRIESEIGRLEHYSFILFESNYDRIERGRDALELRLSNTFESNYDRIERNVLVVSMYVKPRLNRTMIGLKVSPLYSRTINIM